MSLPVFRSASATLPRTIGCAAAGCAAVIVVAVGTDSLLADDPGGRIFVTGAAVSVLAALIDCPWTVTGLTVLAALLTAALLTTGGSAGLVAGVAVAVVMFGALLGRGQRLIGSPV